MGISRKWCLGAPGRLPRLDQKLSFNPTEVISVDNWNYFSAEVAYGSHTVMLFVAQSPETGVGAIREEVTLE